MNSFQARISTVNTYSNKIPVKCDNVYEDLNPELNENQNIWSPPDLFCRARHFLPRANGNNIYACLLGLHLPS